MDATELDKLVAQIGDAILARLGHPPAYPPHAEGLNIEEVVCPGCQQRCVQTCAAKTKQIVAAGADRVSASEKLTSVDPAIASLIDHTLLRPDATREEILQLCREAKQYGFASVCTNPYWVPLVAAELKGSRVKVCTVVGFPFGANTTAIKVAEAEQAIRAGANEIDMVLNIGALRSGDYDTVKLDVQAVTETCHKYGAIVKVILENALLDDSQKVMACSLCKLAGADFVKTSTGFAKSGATARDVALMRAVVGPEMGVKASGGIRTLSDLKAMAAAGASRIGASASVKIVQESVV
ncbi:MAG: deoxyribose-phosphate aldolase [Bryobacteraceae bacterium]|nr:deoxyribose-phosphate aldolase [Bryobacteraceae bacterium]MDW8379991.1 deoxyribose-phosphate aldolase [Bryobacterales bacterium]